MTLRKLYYKDDHYACPMKLGFGHNQASVEDIKLPTACVRFAVEQGCDLNQWLSRPGGKERRSHLAMCANTLQGKLSEELVYRILNFLKLNCSAVDYSRTARGVSDDGDLVLDGKIVMQIKSTSHMGNLLLLERANIAKTLSLFDIFILVRVNPHITKRLLEGIGLNDDLFLKKDIDVICRIIHDNLNNKISLEIAGYATKEMVQEAIRNNNHIAQNEKLGSATMDADNYYIIALDLLPIHHLVKSFPQVV